MGTCLLLSKKLQPPSKISLTHHGSFILADARDTHSGYFSHLQRTRKRLSNIDRCDFLLLPQSMIPSAASQMEACSDRHHCIGGNPCQSAGDCLIGQLCYKEICVPDITFETLTENSKSTSSATAATSELVVTSTVLITITTPAGTNATPATLSSTANGNATTLTLSTITSAISPVYEPPSTGSKHKLMFLSIPFSILALIVVSFVLYKRRRKNHSYSETEEAHPIVQMRGGSEMPYTVGTPVQFGNNTQPWKRGYRDYRGSAASTLTKVKLPNGEQALRAEEERDKRTSAWLAV